MTKKKAKELSLEIWKYLKDHPYIACKRALPDDLLEKVIAMKHCCPLCELYHNPDKYNTMNKCNSVCPLSDDRCSVDSLYERWCIAGRDETRKKYATLIYNKILAWDIKGVKKK